MISPSRRNLPKAVVQRKRRGAEWWTFMPQQGNSKPNKRARSWIFVCEGPHPFDWGAIDFSQLPTPNQLVQLLEIVPISISHRALIAVIHDRKWFVVSENFTSPLRFLNISKEMSE
ncbi:MAG: hypothetical protein AAFX02_04095, partial [Pseudomonadota bacterium]